MAYLLSLLLFVPVFGGISFAESALYPFCKVDSVGYALSLGIL